MNPRGNIFLAIGTRNTGKSFTSLNLAYSFHLRTKGGKSIIIFDHTNNSTYDSFVSQYGTLVSIEYLKENDIRADGVYLVRSDEIDDFADAMVNYVRNSVIIFDDVGVLFNGNLSKMRGKLLKTPKNNFLELIFQAHSIREVAPALLDQVNMFIIKESRDDFDDLPSKLPAQKEIAHCLFEVVRENVSLPSNKKYATIIYDTEAHEVWHYDLKKGEFKIKKGQDFFPFSNQLKIKDYQKKWELRSR